MPNALTYFLYLQVIYNTLASEADLVVTILLPKLSVNQSQDFVFAALIDSR